MKKRLLVTMMLVLIVCLVAAVALTGCSDKKEDKEDINAHLKDNPVYIAVKEKLEEIGSSGEKVELIVNTVDSYDSGDYINYQESTQHIFMVGDKMKIETTDVYRSSNPNSTTRTSTSTTYVYTQDDTGYLVDVAEDGKITKYSMTSIDKYMSTATPQFKVPNNTKLEYDEETESLYFDTKQEMMGMKIETRFYIRVVEDKLWCNQVTKITEPDPSDPTGEAVEESTQTGYVAYVSYGNDVPSFEIPKAVLDAAVDDEYDGSMMP